MNTTAITEITVDTIKENHGQLLRENARLAKENHALRERNTQLQTWKNKQNAYRLALIQGKRETRRHAERRNWWCGIMMGAWMAVWIKIALWALGV